MTAQFAGDVVGGHVLLGSAAATAGEGVSGEIIHVRPDGARDIRQERPRGGALGTRRQGQNQRQDWPDSQSNS